VKSEKIKIMKLDDFNFNEIDYIKIDVQFHELEVIEGGINTLKIIILFYVLRRLGEMKRSYLT